MQAAIDAVPYAGSVKVGLQFKRCFWEEDEAIYGGITYTDLPIRQIAYPTVGAIGCRPRGAARRLSARGGKFLRVHRHDAGRAGQERCRTSAPPFTRTRAIESRTGVAVAWHRVPFTLVALANGPMRLRAETTAICARSMGGSYRLSASTPPTCRRGRRRDSGLA